MPAPCRGAVPTRPSLRAGPPPRGGEGKGLDGANLSLPASGRGAEPEAKPGGGGRGEGEDRAVSRGRSHPAAARPPSPGRGGRSSCYASAMDRPPIVKSWARLLGLLPFLGAVGAVSYARIRGWL